MAVTPERHPEAEQLARYTDDSLPVQERAEIERHLVVCADCREVVADTIAFLHSEQEARPPQPAEPLPFRRRQRWVAAMGIAAAVAASLLVLIRVGWRGPADRPELRELAAASENELRRPVDGRLVGFRYVAPPSPTRGPNDRTVSPEVRIAAANIERLAKDHDSPANRDALGVAYLTLGDFDAAIEAIGDAVQRDSGNAIFQNDLAAALLARAKWRGRAEDWSAALTAADRAIALDPAAKRPEPYFNRALALEGLRLTDQAVQAWLAYQRLDPSGKWFDESVQHLRDLRARPGISG